jgi:thiosulfate dehydrogenase
MTMQFPLLRAFRTAARRAAARARVLGAGLAFACVPAWAGTAPATPADVPSQARQPVNDQLARLGTDKHGELVRRGFRIFTDTPTYARRYSGNALSCQNCHLNAGTKPQAAPIWAAWGEYPAYLVKNDRVVTFEERIQDCFRYSMNGLAPPLDSEELRALVAYSQWLSKGVPVGANLPGRGFPSIARTGSDPNPLRGRDIYAARCAACHGKNGEGQRVDATGRFAIPPLWGYHSYNKGSGLNRIDLMAGFLKANMPLGNPDLTEQQALDLAAWLRLQERWPDPRKGLLKGLIAQ